ncbi:Protein MEI2-like 4 [Apostasia shenzhenica]|uniref:O-fucosyltransferase family protein n=1 Tax=Apostasia shenzhenica TaxID=1088818 RepID=A0A2I0AI97_9ASPA|nr:Protein MEI2-like 4 [Apostasia shenzhenica]
MSNIPAPPPLQSHVLPRGPSNIMSTFVPLHHHHVGSAPSINHSLWDCLDTPFNPSSLSNLAFSGTSPMHPLGISPRDMYPHGGRNCIDPLISPGHVGNPSPQQRSHMLHGRNSLNSAPLSYDSPSDRIRGRRSDVNSNQGDNKKQFELDIDRIIRGEDLRTTLMIKNIPNNEKVASLAYARIQGKAALIAHFQNSSLMNEDKRCRPILFHSDGPNAGDQEPFPIGTNIRSRPGRPRMTNNEEHHQRSPPDSGNGDDLSISKESSSSSSKDSEPGRHEPLCRTDRSSGAPARLWIGALVAGGVQPTSLLVIGILGRFGDVFDVEYFISQAKGFVEIVKELPGDLKSREPFKVDCSKRKGNFDYVEEVLPALKKHRYISITPAMSQRRDRYPLYAKAALCQACYKGIRLNRVLEAKAAQLLMAIPKPFLSLHLRFEPDMVAYSQCEYTNLSPSSSAAIEAARGDRTPFTGNAAITWRNRGKCPLTPNETAFILRALSIPTNTNIYLAAGDGLMEIDGLTSAYTNVHSKSSLLSSEDFVKMHGNTKAALDYFVSINSDEYIATYFGNMDKMVSAMRALKGMHKTLLLNRRAFANPLLGHKPIKRKVKKSDMDRDSTQHAPPLTMATPISRALISPLAPLPPPRISQPLRRKVSGSSAASAMEVRIPAFAAYSASTSKSLLRRPHVSRTVRCEAAGEGTGETFDRTVYEGIYGPWTVESSDVREVILYRSGLVMAASSFVLAASVAFVPESTLRDFLKQNIDILYAVGAGGLGLSLLLIHIYVTPIKRFLQALWAVGVLGSVVTYLNFAKPLDEGLVQYVLDNPSALWFVGPLFAALTGLVFKEGNGNSFFKLVTGLMDGGTKQNLLGLWTVLFILFAARKFQQAVKDDIGDKSVFIFNALPEEKKKALLSKLELKNESTPD